MVAVLGMVSAIFDGKTISAGYHQIPIQDETSDTWQLSSDSRLHFQSRSVHQNGMESQSFETYVMEYMDVLSPYRCDGI